DGADKFKGDYWLVNNVATGPALRAGEAIVGRVNLDDDKTQAWVYLTGQRRVRKLPNPCCDTPAGISAGVAWFDEADVFQGSPSRFDWKLVGKKEMLIPYNTNGALQVKDFDLIGEHHLNPDHVRWELHRVWVIDANLKPGQRHVSPKNRYYIDEDSWNAVLSDRYDAKGQLARTGFGLPINAPDLPGTFVAAWGTYDMNVGQYFITVVMNEQAEQYKTVASQPNSTFTPDGMSGSSAR
ncbi:MAG: DUF1329 domain-containing protein, partial [Rhodoferax sp.]|nr:DUF1329 domain-containing protein [Rhodoferax sp.]